MKAKPIAVTSPARKRWLFRIAALALPLLVLVVVELLLRVFGYGYDTRFFIENTIEGRAVLTDNPKFGWRFFPPLIARTPEPVVLSKRKEPGTCRILVFGESAAMGDPDPAVGLSRMLQVMLEAKFSQKKFEVINVAMTAINSHVIREIAKDCAKLDADFWLIYAGNNEFVGPFGGGTVFGPQVPSLRSIRFTIWFKTTRIGQLLANARQSPRTEWEGMEMFLRQQVGYLDPRVAKVRAHFQENLTDIVRRGTRSGAKVILSTVAVNLRDCAPFASQHKRPLTPDEQVAWNRAWSNAIAAELAGDFRAADKHFDNASGVSGPGLDTHADLWYHRARCLLALGERNDARQLFESARDWDTLRFRADESISKAVKDCSNATVRVIDAARTLATLSSNGIPGAEFFYEHVHLTFDGTYQLARLFLDEIAHQLPAETTRTGTPTREEVARLLCWNEWKQRELFEEVRKRLQQPPFSTQFGHATRDAEWVQRIDALSRALSTERLREIAQDYESALRRAPNDSTFHEDYAKLLRNMGDHAKSLAHWREVVRLLPHEAYGRFYVASETEALSPQASSSVIALYRAALRLDPHMVEAHTAIGRLLAETGDVAAGERELRLALSVRPRYVQARVALAQLLRAQGKTAEAREQYETALRIDPQDAGAHVSFGTLLAASGDVAGATQHYREAIRIEPRNAIAHFNLANSLRETDGNAAIEHYRAAATIDRDFADAHYSLALELSKRGHVAEMLTHFAQYVRLRPDSAEGHFNYGVAFARTRQFSEAAREFRETLRLDPSNAKAKEFLEKVTARQ